MYIFVWVPVGEELHHYCGVFFFFKVWWLWGSVLSPTLWQKCFILTWRSELRESQRLSPLTSLFFWASCCFLCNLSLHYVEDWGEKLQIGEYWWGSLCVESFSFLCCSVGIKYVCCCCLALPPHIWQNVFIISCDKSYKVTSSKPFERLETKF